MKQTLFLLLPLALLLNSCKHPTIKLPEEPWHALAYNESNKTLRRWDGRVNVMLMGNFTPTDSIMVQNSIFQLNQLCETVKLYLVNEGKQQLNIYFADTLCVERFGSMRRPSVSQKLMHQFTHVNGKLSIYSQAVLIDEVPENFRQNYFNNIIAYALFPNVLDGFYRFKSGAEMVKLPRTIFFARRDVDGSPYLQELSSFDKSVLQAVYGSNYANNISAAIKQYTRIPVWLKKNAYIVLILPLVILLFLIVAISNLLYRKLDGLVCKPLRRFNTVSVFSLILTGTTAAFYYIFSSKLADPEFTFYHPLDVFAAIVFIVLLGLPAMNLIRVIEQLVQRKMHDRILKVLLLFLSTTLAPSLTVLVLYQLYLISGGEPIDVKVLGYILLVFLIVGILRAIISFFILKEKDIKTEAELKLAHLRELKTKAELNALHSKINPHFLYNALNSIAGLASIDAHKTEQMALSLSKLFRYSINKEQADWSTLEEEVEMAKIYLDIEKVRFDDHMSFDIEMPIELRSIIVPRFILQPLVENAVKHGISKNVNPGEIQVKISKTKKWLEISVADSGPEFSINIEPGFGLQGIYDKLEIMYPNRFELHFLSSPQKQVILKIG